MLKYNIGEVVVIGNMLCGHGFEVGEKVRIESKYSINTSAGHYGADSLSRPYEVPNCFINDEEIDHEATAELNAPKVEEATKVEATTTFNNPKVNKPKSEKKFVSKTVSERKPTIRQNVETILRDVPGSRDDDKLLILMYWSSYDGIVKDGLVSPSDVLNKATTPESLTRARRLIQEEGLYPPTDTTVIARRSKERNMRSAVRQGEVV